MWFRKMSFIIIASQQHQSVSPALARLVFKMNRIKASNDFAFPTNFESISKRTYYLYYLCDVENSMNEDDERKYICPITFPEGQ